MHQRRRSHNRIKKDFYAEIEDILSRLKNSKIRIILGDMNAKIEKEQFL